MMKIHAGTCAMQMKRMFHPVGQGAFYSEEFYSDKDRLLFRIVYDCGTKTSKKRVVPNQVIGQAFPDKDTIDILFVSHFDSDHVSMISDLIKDRKVRRVVLPLLHDEECAVLRALYEYEGNTFGLRLLTDPEQAFGSETAIYRILPDEGESAMSRDSDPQREDGEEWVLNIGSDGNPVGCVESGMSNIPSRSVISCFNNVWRYIPYNHEYVKRHEALMAEISHRPDLDENRLGDASYVSEKKKELLDVYKALHEDGFGEINENSMLVLSGPSTESGQQYTWIVEAISIAHEAKALACCALTSRVACVFCGDSDFNKVDIRKIYHLYWNTVGTVQIPHHGSERSFATEFLADNAHLVCPISVGSVNLHGHPSPNVVSEILKAHSIPLIVDEYQWLCMSLTMCEKAWLRA